MSDQDSLNAEAQEIEADVASENASITAIQAQIAALEANQGSGQPLDFTALKQAVADLGTASASLGSVAAPPAAPPAAP